MFVKKLLLLIVIAGLALVGAAYFLVRQQRAHAGPVAAPAHGAPQRGAEEPDGAALPGITSKRAGIEPGASGPASAVRTTWGTRLVTRDGGRALSGVALRVKLLSPDATTEDVALVSDQDGEAGPIDLDFERHPAAEVSVDPGPQWAGFTSTVRFTAGRANHDLLELAPPAMLSVRVIDLTRDAPLPAAQVTLHDASRLVGEATCDRQGLARFPWEAAGGPFTVRASAPGFCAVTWAAFARPPSADQELELLLAPTGILRVRVQDEAGRPLSNCRVTASLVEENLGPASSVHDARVTVARWEPPSEESGAYVFSSLPCEVVLVLWAATEEGLEGKELAKIGAPPGAAEVTLTVARGEGTEIWTLDDHAAPLAGVTLGMDQESLGTTDEIGHLSLPLQESKRGQELWAFKPGYALAWQSWAPEQGKMVYRLVRENGIAGTVVDSSGRPQKLVRITPLLGAREESREERRRRGEFVVQKGGARATGTDSSGTFTLHGFSGAWADLHVRKPKSGSFEVHDVLVGTQDLVITIPDEDTLGQGQGIALSIVVTDELSGAPLSGASVVAFYVPNPQARSFEDPRSGTTRSDGMVRLTFAQQGHYLVTVSADGYVPYSAAIADYPVGEHSVEVGLALSGELEILLVDAGGVGQAGYWITALDPDGASVQFEHSEGGGRSSSSGIMSDVKGRAFANRMPGGKLTLEVREEHGRKGEALVRKEVEVIPGERVGVEMRLP